MKRLLFVLAVLVGFSGKSEAQGCFGPACGGGSSTITAGATATVSCTDGAFLYSLTNLIQCGTRLYVSGNKVVLTGDSTYSSFTISNGAYSLYLGTNSSKATIFSCTDSSCTASSPLDLAGDPVTIRNGSVTAYTSTAGATTIGSASVAGTTVPLTVIRNTSSGNIVNFQTTAGSTVSYVDNSGTLFAPSATGYSFAGATTYKITNPVSTRIAFDSNGSVFLASSSTYGTEVSSDGINFFPGAVTGVPDTFLDANEAAAILQMGRDVNGAAVNQTFKAHDGITGTDIAGANLTLAGGRGTGIGASGNVILQTAPALATGTTAQTLEERFKIVGKQFALTDNTIATFLVQTLGNDTGGGGTIHYCVRSYNATTAADECGSADFNGIDVTAGAGGEVCTITKVGTPAQALSGATLATTFAGTAGTDLCSFRITADTSVATPTALYIKYTVVHSGTPITAQ